MRRRLLVLVACWVGVFVTIIIAKKIAAVAMSSDSSMAHVVSHTTNPNPEAGFSLLDSLPGRTGATRMSELVISNTIAVDEITTMLDPTRTRLRACNPLVMATANSSVVYYELSFKLVDIGGGLYTPEDIVLERTTEPFSELARSCVIWATQDAKARLSAPPRGRISYPYCFH